MIKTIVVVCSLLAGMALAQHQHHSQPGLPVEMYTGMGNLHHPVSTKNPEAQKHFNQGLALLYGFNHEEAVKQFQRAGALDPDLAMAYWGVALVNGQNYNAPEFPELLKVARENLKKAQALAPKASPGEQAYIAALAKRYDEAVADPAQREVAYSAAMGQVMQQFPDDLDAATLHAESMMNQRPWQLWSKDGTPAPNTERIIEILESVLRRNPQHIGANHYYIHAVEASKNPARAMAAADRLRNLKLSAGHLVHMPAHVYFRTGDYPQAADVNIVAAKVDRDYLAAGATKPGIYSMMYYSHNIHFQALADAMAGRYERAIKAAQALSDHVEPALKEMPLVEVFLPVRTYVLVRFGKWDEVLALPEPDASLRLHHSTWQWARGMAMTAKGDLAAADREYQALRAARAKVPADAMVDKNPLSTVLEVAEHMLAGRIATAKKDYPAAEQHYQKAAAIHDDFNYIEPPEWPFPVRESLGGMLLAAGRHADAEKAFREDLARFPRNGRSLYGLLESLKAQGKQENAKFVELEYASAWNQADTILRPDEIEVGSIRKDVTVAGQEKKKAVVGATAQ